MDFKWNKWKEIEFENPKASAQNGWELNQNIWTLIRKHLYQPEELNSKDCLEGIKNLLKQYALYESEIEARS